MISMLFLKALSDIGFIYSIFSPILYILKINRVVFFAGWVMQSVAYSMSYQLKDRGWLRYLPFALCFLPLAADFSMKSFLFLVPGMIYGIYYAKVGPYYLDREQQISIFSRFWLIAAAECFGTLVMGEVTIVGDWIIPLSLITVVAQILLMRALRHDPAVYLSPRYQATDLGILAVMGLVVSFLSSDMVRHNVMSTIKYFYFTFVVPVLLIFIRIIAQLIALLVIPIQKLIAKNAPDQKIELNTQSFEEMLEIEQPEFDPNAAERIKYIMIGIGTLIALAIIIAIFHYLSPGKKDRNRTPQSTIRRSFNQNKKSRAQETESSEFSAQVRARYKSYLKLYSKMHLPRKAASTSSDIERVSLNHFDKDASRRMRQLYIAARYNDSSSAEDAEEAKVLLKTLKDTAE